MEGEGWGCATPRVPKLSVVELSGKTADLSRSDFAIGYAFSDPRSIFDPVMRGKRSNFREIDSFQLYM